MSGTNRTLRSKGLLGDLTNLFCPRFCAVCGQRLTPDEPLLCSHCLLQLPYTQITCFTDNEVTQHFVAHVPVIRGYTHIRYRGEPDSQALLSKLKYYSRPDVGDRMGETIANELLPQGFFDGIEAIVPVPLHWRRYVKRSYNQSHRLAKGLARVTGLPVRTHIVRRIRNNESQTSLSPEQRTENVRGIFKARPTHHRHLLLVDDVLTTGATLVSCAQAIAERNPGVCFSILTLAKV